MDHANTEPIALSNPWWTKRWVQNAGLVLAAAIVVYGLIYWDVVSRAREAYQEGEKYMRWHENPRLKEEHFASQFAKEKKSLDQLLEKKKISEEDYKEKIDALQFDKDFAMEESSLKYAYQWYKDTYELFSPPESKWVQMARAKAPRVLELWKEELRSKNIPFEDYMFE